MADISDQAVENATGKDWRQWFSLLDKSEATNLDHKQIVSWLAENGVASGWWQQSITVEYEKHIGRRVEGQTQDADFQIGVSRTLPIESKLLWKSLVGEWLNLWLGDINEIDLKKGADYATNDGVTGQIRSIVPAKKLRITRSVGGKPPTTLQIYLEAKGERSRLLFHQEKLASSKQRQDMRHHWQSVLDAIEKQSEQT